MKNNIKSTEMSIDEDLKERLEQVRVKYDLPDIEQTMHFLVRRGIRRSGEQLIGRRRALRIVKG